MNEPNFMALVRVWLKDHPRFNQLVIEDADSDYVLLYANCSEKHNVAPPGDKLWWVATVTDEHTWSRSIWSCGANHNHAYRIKPGRNKGVPLGPSLVAEPTNSRFVPGECKLISRKIVPAHPDVFKAIEEVIESGLPPEMK